MVKRPAMLSATFVSKVREPGVYGDGRGGYGLYLRVHKTKIGRISKSWGQRVRVGGKLTNLGLGSFPVISLKEARARALANRQRIEQGHDPRGAGILTFEKAAEKVISIRAREWKGPRSTEQWRSSLRRFAHPVIGSKRVDQVNSADVLAVLTPIWSSKRVTAQRVRNRISIVMQWAIAKGYRPDDPAGEAINGALPRNGNRVTHYRALPYREVGAALAKVKASGSAPALKLALEFLVLTAARSGEMRGATWEEINLEDRVWEIPSGRTKTRAAHRIPLSDRTRAVLREARELSDGSELVFVKDGRKLGKSALSMLLRRHDIPCTAHGFRSSFRDWCAETGVRREVAEASLGHVVKGVEGAYFRTRLFGHRAIVLQDWSVFVGSPTGPKPPAESRARGRLRGLARGLRDTTSPE